MACEHHQIEHLIYQYASAIDRGDFDALGALFANGCITYMPSGWQIQGADEVANYMSSTLQIYPETGTPCTIHQISNVDICIDAASKTATSNAVFFVHQIIGDQTMNIICSGRYFDRFAKGNNAWHFVERRVLPEFFGDLSRHLKSKLGTAHLKSI